MTRSIIHLNIADFAAAVETNLQPSLKSYPIIIAPIGSPRAVVYDMSEAAYREGIRKGMPLSRAKRRNKKIKIIPPRFNRYEQVMKTLLKETLAFTPCIESGTTDGHIFLDVTGSTRLFGPPADVAFKLKKLFNKAFDLDPVWSVATNKLVAKVATRMVKPIGEYIVPPGDEKAFLSPLPVHLIPGLAKTDLKKFFEFNLFYISQARHLTLEQLWVPFRQKAPLIHDWIRGIDSSPVTRFCETRSSIRTDHEFADDTNTADLLKKALFLLIERICKTLRDRKLTGAAAKLILLYSDGLQTRSTLKFSPATSNDMVLFKHGLHLLDRAWTRRVRIRHMRLICEKLSPHQIQGDLFSNQTKEVKQTDLILAMDRIRAKFGRRSITTGLTLIDEST